MSQTQLKNTNIKSMLPIKRIVLNVIYVLRVLYSFLLSSRKCVVCEEETSNGLCSDCANDLFFAPLEHKRKFLQEYCTCCSKPLISENEMCISCKKELEEKKNVVHLSVLLFPYIGKYVDIVLKWKKEDVRELSVLFAKVIAQHIEKTPMLQGIPIVPVPPRPRKLKTKGWDQIEDVCSFLETMHGAKIVRLLARKDGHTQKGLSREERERNIKRQFYIKKNILKKLQKAKASKESIAVPKKVILLDDVITTGSTISACTEALKTAGCEEIIDMTLFYN